MFTQTFTRALSRLGLDQRGDATLTRPEVRGEVNVETARSIARISVVGASGAGKSTVARMAAAHLGVPWIELDAIHHGPNWTETPLPSCGALSANLLLVMPG